MADQKRWFKVWTSIVANANFAEMSLEDIGRWALLGAATALDGDAGSLAVPGAGRELCRLMRTESKLEALALLARFPGLIVSSAPPRWPHGHDKPPVCDGEIWMPPVAGCGACVPPGYEVASCRGSRCLESWCERYGTIFVTFKKWFTYQRDATASERGKTLRSKRRGEEKRGEVKERSKEKFAANVTVDGLVAELQPLEAYAGLDVRGTVLRCETWCRAKRKALTRMRVVNWLNRDAADMVAGTRDTADPYAKFPRA